MIADNFAPVGSPLADGGDDLVPSLITTSVTTSATTTTTPARAISVRLRTWARRSAARCIAIFSRVVRRCLLLLALPIACFDLLPAMPMFARSPLPALHRRASSCLRRRAMRRAGSSRLPESTLNRDKDQWVPPQLWLGYGGGISPGLRARQAAGFVRSPSTSSRRARLAAIHGSLSGSAAVSAASRSSSVFP